MADGTGRTGCYLQKTYQLDKS